MSIATWGLSPLHHWFLRGGFSGRVNWSYICEYSQHTKSKTLTLPRSGLKLFWTHKTKWNRCTHAAHTHAQSHMLVMLCTTKIRDIMAQWLPLHSRPVFRDGFLLADTIWCWNSCWVGSTLSFSVGFSSNPGNLHKECTHPNGWGVKNTHP